MTDKSKELAREALELFPAFERLNEEQQEFAVAQFEEKLLAADADKPLSIKRARRELKELFKTARAI